MDQNRFTDTHRIVIGPIVLTRSGGPSAFGETVGGVSGDAT